LQRLTAGLTTCSRVALRRLLCPFGCGLVTQPLKPLRRLRCQQLGSGDVGASRNPSAEFLSDLGR
jgi:hypothetical protein